MIVDNRCPKHDSGAYPAVIFTGVADEIDPKRLETAVGRCRYGGALVRYAIRVELFAGIGGLRSSMASANIEWANDIS